MIKRLFRNLSAKAKTERWSLSPANLDKFFFYLLVLFLPTELGLHFWPSFAYIDGVRIDYLSPTLYTTDILIFLLFTICIFTRRLIIKPNIYFLFFYVLLLLGILLSKSPTAGIYGLVKLSEFLFVGFYIFKRISLNNLLLKIISGGILFESLLGIFQFINKGSLQGVFYFFGERAFNGQTPNIANASINGSLVLRPYATFPHPNVFSSFLLLGITLLFLYANPKTKIEKLYYFFCIVIGCIALILTFSRVALFCFAILILYKFLNLLKLKSIKNIGLLISLICILTFIALPYLGRFTGFNLTDESITQRENLNSAAVSMIHSNPLLGVGLNNFLINLDNNLPPGKTFFYLQPVHNIFLLATSQIGVFAGIMFFALLLLAYQNAEKRMRLVLIFIFILGSFDHYFLTLQQGQILLSVVLGLSFSKQRTSFLVE